MVELEAPEASVASSRRAQKLHKEQTKKDSHKVSKESRKGRKRGEESL